MMREVANYFKGNKYSISSLSFFIFLLAYIVKKYNSTLDSLKWGLYLIIKRLISGPMLTNQSFGMEYMVYASRKNDEKNKDKYRNLMNATEIDFEHTRNEMRAMFTKGWTPKGIIREAFEVEGTSCEWIYCDNPINVLNNKKVPNEKESKIIFFLHGGGYVILSIDTHIDLISRICRSSGATSTRVLAIEYKLAPEHPFPFQLNESVKVFKWLINQRHVSPSNIVFCGDSAGGGLCIATALYLRDNHIALPQALALMSPWVDLECNDHSFERNKETDYLSRDKCKVTGLAYAGKENLRHPLASPLFADLTNLPPMLIQASDKEVFIDSILSFYKKARGSGVRVSLEVYRDQPHVFQWFNRLCPRIAQEAVSSIAHFIIDRIALDRIPKRVTTEELNPNKHTNLVMYHYDERK